MQRFASEIVGLFGFQMRSLRERTTCGFLMATVLLLGVYSIDLFTTIVNAKILTTRSEQQAAGRQLATPIVPIKHNTLLSLGTVTTSVFEATIHWAIPYKPLSPDELLLEVKQGYRYVVLDMSFRNLSSEKDVDLGMVILTSLVQDECGRVYFAEPLAIASLQRDYPFPQHEEQYKKMRGILKPGESCRTTVIAFEAPEEVNSFILTMEDGSGSNKVHKTKFTVR